ncbi:hypothetical protein NUM3379_04430 [Kineococcus sp. NUM-3379]
MSAGGEPDDGVPPDEPPVEVLDADGYAVERGAAAYRTWAGSLGSRACSGGCARSPTSELLRPGTAHVPPGREAEAGTLALLSRDRRDLGPGPAECAGPLLVHFEGSFDCHGSCGGRVLGVRHDVDEAVWPCDARSLPSTDEIPAGCYRCGRARAPGHRR